MKWIIPKRLQFTSDSSGESQQYSQIYQNRVFTELKQYIGKAYQKIITHFLEKGQADKIPVRIQCI